MNFHRAYPPSTHGNGMLMLRALCASMDGPRRREFAGTLSLHEPIARMEVYGLPDESRNGGHLQGQIEMAPAMAVLIRLGDRDLIEGALRGPRLREPKPWVQSREFTGANEGVEQSVLREALAMADVATLDLGLAVFSGAERPGFQRPLPLFGGSGREHGTALGEFASRADAHPYPQVLACARWTLARHVEMTEEMFALPAGSSESKSHAKSRADQIARAQAGGPHSLLSLGLQWGSNHLCRAALELGSHADFDDAWNAFDNGVVKLASELWKIAEAALADGSLDAGGPRAFDNGRYSRDGDEARLTAKQRRERCVEKMGETLESLAMRVDKGSRSGMDAELAQAQAHAIGDFAMEALGSRPGDKAAARLVAAAMPLSHTFENPAKWVRLARAAHPRPSPAELAALAKAGKWALATARLDDARKSAKPALPQAWLAEALSACEAGVAREIAEGSEDRWIDGARVKAKPKDIHSMWSARLALELSARELGWKPDMRPVDKLKAMGSFLPGEVAAAQGRFEAAALAKESPKAAASSKGPPRV